MEKGIKNKYLVGFTCFFLLIFIPIVTSAQVPQKMNYQGYLTDSAGVPINGPVLIVFTIYDDYTGGSALWSEALNVPVSQGLVQVVLGDISPVNLMFDKAYYFGIKVGSDSEMMPRSRLVTVPYAFRAKYAEGAVPEDNSVTSSKILDGAVGTGKLSASSVTEPKLSHDGTLIDVGGGVIGVNVGTSANRIVRLDGSGRLPLVDGSQLLNLSMTLPDNSVTTPKLQDGAVTGTKIAYNAISTTQLSNQSVTPPKVNPTGAVSGQALMYDGASVVWGNPTSAPVNLPYSGTVSSSSPAFSITNTGEGGAGVYQITNPSNTEDALFVKTTGTGTAGYFEVDNPTSNQPALHAKVTNGTGDAGYFEGDVTVTGAMTAASFTGSGASLTNVNADTLDGQHASAFLTAGQVNSIATEMIQASAVTTGKIVDGAVTDAKITGLISGSKIGTHSHAGGDITFGTLPDSVLSLNAALLDNAQTFTGLKSFNPSSGTVPFIVNGNKQGLVIHLNADMLDGQHASDFVTAGQVESVTSSMIVDGQVGASDINSSQIQLRVNGSCTAGSSIRVINADGTVTCETDDVGTFSGWGLTGNTGTNPSTNFVGTTDNQPLHFRVNNTVALRIMPNSTSPNIVGGHPNNTVSPGVVGATIGGGGSTWPNTEFLNSISDHFGTIGGGVRNRAGNGDGDYDNATYATVGGGDSNTASGDYATVGGGGGNTASGATATVGGGWQNTASNTYATVGGGWANTAGGEAATVAGGYYNTASDTWATVGGGKSNTASDSAATVGGGEQNTASGNEATVGGGFYNTAGARATVGGGYYNWASGAYATVGGGHQNTASGIDATVGGGYYNTAGGIDATVGGGTLNGASGNEATVGGGRANIASSMHATVGGGTNNTASGYQAIIAGGSTNEATASLSAIGGGLSNLASGGYAVVGGGNNNTVSGTAATVPGGENNLAQGSYSFAAGRRAKATVDGCFVWADSTNADLNCQHVDRFLTRAAAGYQLYTNSGMSSYAWLPPGSGAWENYSDRNAKENFASVDGTEILNRLASIPIVTWNYKTQDPSIRHLGPVAQDFFAAFNIGQDDKHISTVNADGVALAAIQGLYQLTKEKEARIAQLESLLSSLGQRLSELEGRMGGGVR